ncbi:protein unc-50-like protein isoform X2 [Gossypium australe]|uniref:Protein unc-50-like protein isoform X2 n=1 Tax=Gossypium australe TaxID=47621 RepID=A0A5B6V1E6_9ROSI|nr:protein unc-50-like protein isoform X2 [Gossypium australe]
MQQLYAFDVHCNSFFPMFVMLYVLPFLERTTFFLYPIGVIIVLSPILILSGFNPSRYFMNMYFSQRV